MPTTVDQTVRRGDRAATLLLVAAVAYLSIAGILKLWVLQDHRGLPQSWPFRITVGLLYFIWLFGTVAGFVLGFRARSHSAIRYASLAMLVGFIAVVITSVPTYLWQVSRVLWRALVWMPPVAVFAGLLVLCAWPAQRRRGRAR